MLSNWTEWQYNTANSTGYSPFQVVYGGPPPSIPPYLLGSPANGAVESTLLSQDELLATLGLNLHKAMKR